MFTQQQLISILSSLPDPAFILTRSGRYAAVFGGKDLRHYHDGSGLVGRSMFEMLKEEKARWFATEIEKALASGVLHIVEYELSGSDVKGAGDGPSHSIWFEGRVQALDFQVEGEAAVVWVASNITDKNDVQQKLRQLSETDALTGLYNRRKLIETLDHRLAIFEQEKSQTSLLVFDLDNFKQLNDQMGHHAGDMALVEIARLCRQHLRQNDVIARFGGDEFVVVMPGTHRNDALEIAERLRENVPITLKQSLRYEATISGGVSEFGQPDRFSSDILKRADEGLYLSKRAGRNRVSAL
ncbi:MULTISPECIES: sensor domain-containing diguanylate cyclase [Agrobacterium]|uniref:sensor domain-containing diguanylate cyclase n=1 Tax=Agrobacterium TaxID=357 RepID=UPI001295D195|nr:MULTISPECIES: sensor domain-containing diguanylate cyclase [Agrobacterium]MQB08791.1 sensor domain-containing diguanylate cyclase [Agrobacterium sp. ICMP 6402]NTZ89771.1 GGDEF domain-containing protein [Agrobacterium tumefaciens]